MASSLHVGRVVGGLPGWSLCLWPASLGSPPGKKWEAGRFESIDRLLEAGERGRGEGWGWGVRALGGGGRHGVEHWWLVGGDGVSEWAQGLRRAVGREGRIGRESARCITLEASMSAMSSCQSGCDGRGSGERGDGGTGGVEKESVIPGSVSDQRRLREIGRMPVSIEWRRNQRPIFDRATPAARHNLRASKTLKRNMMSRPEYAMTTICKPPPAIQVS